jgi:hypothetical protein
MLSLILLVFALVLFLLAAFVPGIDPNLNPLRSRLTCFGLACLAGAEILARATTIGLLKG